jgi:hypothetical protein
MTNASAGKTELNTRIIYAILLPPILFFTLLLLLSCGTRDNSIETTANTHSEKIIEDGSLFLFDHDKIVIDETDTAGIRIKNSNLYLDIYEDMVIMGEVENNSKGNKTDIEITLDFYNKNGEKIISRTIPAFANYMRSGSRLPFCYYLDKKEKYIEISLVKIGVNYKDYNEAFRGNPIVKTENYYYGNSGEYLVVEGRVFNIGSGRVKNLKLFCTFYDSKDRVVLIKKCYLLREEMIPDEEQKFSIKIPFDEYIPEFTHYRFGIFFEDEIKTPG